MGSYTHMGAQCRVFWVEIRVFCGNISQGTGMCVIDMIRKLLAVLRISVGKYKSCDEIWVLYVGFLG